MLRNMLGGYFDEHTIKVTILQYKNAMKIWKISISDQ